MAFQNINNNKINKLNDDFFLFSQFSCHLNGNLCIENWKIILTSPLQIDGTLEKRAGAIEFRSSFTLKGNFCWNKTCFDCWRSWNTWIFNSQRNKLLIASSDGENCHCLSNLKKQTKKWKALQKNHLNFTDHLFHECGGNLLYNLLSSFYCLFTIKAVKAVIFIIFHPTMKFQLKFKC